MKRINKGSRNHKWLKIVNSQKGKFRPNTPGRDENTRSLRRHGFAKLKNGQMSLTTKGKNALRDVEKR